VLLRMPIPFSNCFNKQDFDILVGRQWQIVLVYKDVPKKLRRATMSRCRQRAISSYCSGSVRLHCGGRTIGKGFISPLSGIEVG
jgi:hypothetical protein